MRASAISDGFWLLVCVSTPLVFLLEWLCIVHTHRLLDGMLQWVDFMVSADVLMPWFEQFWIHMNELGSKHARSFPLFEKGLI